MQENTVRDERNNVLSLNRLRPSILLKREMVDRPHMNRIDVVLEADRNIVFLEVAEDLDGSQSWLQPYDDSR